MVTAKLLQNEHFLYGTCWHNCSVWQQRAVNIHQLHKQNAQSFGNNLD